MGIDFNRRIMVTNPTLYGLGMGIAGMGMVAIMTGLITAYAEEDFVLPAMAWCALGVPVVVAGTIMLLCGLRRS
jgi:tetrahydromethanopterin S-methyltransferase subunit C